MSRAEAEQIVRRYAERLHEAHYPVRDLYLFGSYAKNMFHKWSDIDVAVVTDDTPSDYYAAQKRLRELAAEVDVRLEPRGISASDFAEDWQPLVHEVKTTGRLLYTEPAA